MNKPPVTVVCVLRPSEVFNPSWVWALKRGIARCLPDAEFRCVTDVASIGMFAAHMAHPEWQRHWCLVNWWRPGLFTGRVLAMGLDTLPTGDLSDLANYDGPMAGISDFYQPKNLASGVMSWHADEGAILYETFCKDATGIMRRYPRMDPWMRTIIPNAVRLQDKFPGQIVSLKKEGKRGAPMNARLVVGHGNPRLNQPSAGWAHAAWSSLAQPEQRRAA